MAGDDRVQLGDKTPPTLQEKLATGLVALTALEAVTLLDLASKTSEGLVGNGLRLVVGDRREDSLFFDARSAGITRGGGADRYSAAQLAVTIGVPTDGPQRPVAVRLVAGTTIVYQAKVFGLVPVAPKMLTCWSVYHKYLLALRAALTKADPSSGAEIVIDPSFGEYRRQ